MLSQFPHENGEQGKQDVTSHLVFEALLQHPPHPKTGLVSLHSSTDRELTTS